ncbi:MAG: RIP metalloprotease RseP [Acidobacteriota bacterium]|nr:RIP metalloprotease RseP [Acidobacteriota bacterium]
MPVRRSEEHEVVVLTSLAAFVFVLGVLVVVHELGHYLLARRIGVRVLTFSLGFGPKLLTVRRGDTDYCISAIPLGGYVKMAGESPDEARAGLDHEFLSKTKWERFQVLVMGPTMNIVLAVVVMTVVLYQGAEVPIYEEQPPVVGAVTEGSPAETAGILPGDLIVSVAGDSVPTWEALFMAVMPRAERELDVVVQRGERSVTLHVTPAAQTRFAVGNIGVLPEMHPQIRDVAPGEPATRAGIQSGDIIVAVDGDPVAHEEFIQRINESPDVALTLTVRRADAEREIEVTPALRGDVGLIGVSLSPYELRTIEPGPLQAVQMSFERNYEWSGLIFRTLWGLLTRETSPSQLMGPVGIAQLSGGAAQVGFIALFTLMAMISLNLGILNLLPIPVLDGGHIFILALEGVSGRDFSVRVKEKMLLAGFVVLMMLMVTVIYNDLARIAWIEALMPWR